MVKLKRLLSFLVFPFQNSKWIRYFSEYLPYGDDGEAFYFSLYGEKCCVYSIDDIFLNKCLLEEFKKKYKVKYFSYFRNSAFESDMSIPNYQQMHFFIMLKPRLFVEFDSMRYYRIYYDYRYEETELQEVLKIFRKNQKIDWPRSLKYIQLN